MDKPKCKHCDDTRLVCEDHPDKPWEGTSDSDNACDCGGAGMFCGYCSEENGVTDG